MDQIEDYCPAARVRELIERQRRRERELSSLYATARSVTVLRGLDEVLSSVVRHAHDLIGTDITYLTVLEKDASHLRVRATAGTLSPGFDESVHAPAHIGIAGRVARTRAPYWESDYLASTEIVHDPVVDRAIEAEGIVSMLGVPLIAGDRFLGTLIAANREERPFVRDDVALLSAFGDHAAVALENARLYDESPGERYATWKRRTRRSKRGRGHPRGAHPGGVGGRRRGRSRGSRSRNPRGRRPGTRPCPSRGRLPGGAR